MKSIKTYIISLPMIFLFLGLKKVALNSEIKEFAITINHPGEKEPIQVILYQVVNDDDFPVQYYMDVPSVICLEQVCKIIPVRLFWNDLGEYQKYELEQGATLEKYKADLFEPEDYKKLQHILSDKNSPFKDVYYDEILTVPTVDDTDAVSGATALQLNEEDTVPGAALGCYTLWHWANGEIVQKIKNLTGATLTKQQKLQLVNQNKAVYYNVIIQSFNKDKIDAELIDQVFKKGNTSHRLQVFNLFHHSKNTSVKILESMSKTLVINKNYQEISSFLTLLEAKKIHSLSIIKDVFSLLKSDFIIARRVYWFLQNQTISEEQKQTLKGFYQKNKNKL